MIMEKIQSSDLGSGKVGRLLLKLALPSVIAQLINMLYNIVDRIYIGHMPVVGASALTGVGLCFPIIILISAFASLAGAGGAPRAAIEMGRGNNKNAEHILGNCLSTLIIIAFILTAILLLFSESLLYLFGASEKTLPYAMEYLQIYVIGSISVMLVLGMNPFITTQGFSAFSMLTTVIGALLNIVLDPIFIFQFNLGVRGAAIATVLSQAVSAVWVLCFLTGKRTFLKLRICNMKIAPKVILPCLALGVSAFVMQSTEGLVNICFNSSLSRYYGDVAVGAMTIMSSIMQILVMLMTGICQGAQPILSFNYGAGKQDRVKLTFKYQFIACITYSVVFYVIVMFGAEYVTGIFTSNTDLVQYTSNTMHIYMAAIFALGIQMSCQQSFIALGQAKISLLLACLRKLILLIPLIYILPNFFTDKVFAVFLAEPVSDAIATLVTATIFFIKFNAILKKNTDPSFY